MPKKSQTREEMERAVGKLQEERLKMDMEFSKLYGREEPTYLPQQKSSRRLTCDEMETAMRSMQIERQRQDEENRRLVAERQRLIREQQRLEQDSHQSREYFSWFFGQKASSSTPARDADPDKLLESGKYKPPV